MTVEQRLDQLEKCNKRLTVALTMTVVTMAATGLKDAHFNRVTARHIWVKNDAGEIVVGLGANAHDGNGAVTTWSAKGKDLVKLNSSDNGGLVEVVNKTGLKGEAIAQMHADEYGNGVVGAWNRKGKGRTLQPGP